MLKVLFIAMSLCISSVLAQPLVVGITGANNDYRKSTAQALVEKFSKKNVNVVCINQSDFYQGGGVQPAADFRLDLMIEKITDVVADRGGVIIHDGTGSEDGINFNVDIVLVLGEHILSFTNLVDVFLYVHSAKKIVDHQRYPVGGNTRLFYFNAHEPDVFSRVYKQVEQEYVLKRFKSKL